MNKELASIYKNRLIANGGLAFVDVAAGLVQTVSFQENSGNDNTTIVKRMPVATDTNITEGCDFKKEQAMVPNSKLKGILYFEDGGIASAGMKGSRQILRSTLTLVVWMNRARFSTEVYGALETAAIAEIMQKIGFNRPVHEGNLQSVNPKLGSILQQDANIFSRYTYNEVETQYLRPPFGFFAMTILTDFMVNPACVGTIQEGGTICY